MKEEIHVPLKVLLVKRRGVQADLDALALRCDGADNLQGICAVWGWARRQGMEDEDRGRGYLSRERKILCITHGEKSILDGIYDAQHIGRKECGIPCIIKMREKQDTTLTLFRQGSFRVPLASFLSATCCVISKAWNTAHGRGFWWIEDFRRRVDLSHYLGGLVFGGRAGKGHNAGRWYSLQKPRACSRG